MLKERWGDLRGLIVSVYSIFRQTDGQIRTFSFSLKPSAPQGKSRSLSFTLEDIKICFLGDGSGRVGRDKNWGGIFSLNLFWDFGLK